MDSFNQIPDFLLCNPKGTDLQFYVSRRLYRMLDNEFDDMEIFSRHCCIDGVEATLNLFQQDKRFKNLCLSIAEDGRYMFEI